MPDDSTAKSNSESILDKYLEELPPDWAVELNKKLNTIADKLSEFDKRLNTISKAADDLDLIVSILNERKL